MVRPKQVRPDGTPIDVRPFERRDLKRVVAIEKASFAKDAWPPELFVQYWHASPELFLVARQGGRIAGYSIALINWRGAELESIAVDPRYRGRGVAQALLDTEVARLGSQGAGTLRLMVSAANTSALRLYRQYGFIRTRLVKCYYGAGRDAWRMRLKPLASRPKQQTDEQTEPNSRQKMPI